MSTDRALRALENGCALTVGTFDGIHLGHLDVLARLVAAARERGLPAVALTFDPHPLAVLDPTAAPRVLTPGSERAEAIVERSSIDYLVCLGFTRELAQYSAERFVVEQLIGRFGMRHLVIGHDHGLGRGREGNAANLAALGVAHGFTTEVVAPVHGPNGEPLSSSHVRRSVAYGDLEGARRLLGRRYSLRGTVVQGARRGRTIGYPTLNLSIPDRAKLLPPVGVYAVRATGPQGTFGGMMNLGGRPTFDDLDVVPEVHLFGASGDWYGHSVRVELVSRLRDVQPFADVSALREQLAADAVAARNALTQP